MHNISLIYIIIVLMSAGSAFYGLLHCLRQLRMPWRRTLAAAALLALFSALHQILLSYGNYHDLGALHYLFYLTAFAANFGLLALPAVLLSDIVQSLLRLACGRVLTTRSGLACRRILGAAFLTLFAAGALLAEISAIKPPVIKAQDIYVKNLHPALNGFTIAQLSDVHASPFFTAWRSEAMVQTVQAAAPDLIVFTGDQADGTPPERTAALQPFTKLKAPYGVFFIAGNHEYITGFKPWVQWYQEEGFTLLVNAAVRVPVNDAVITVAGLDDNQGDRAGEPGFTGPDINLALKDAAPDDFRLLLAHQPRLARDYAAAPYAVDLMLSGHTHAGQVPLLNALTALANQGFLQGLYQVADMQLIVSAGAGLWQGFAARLGTQSEIPLLTLRRAPQPQRLMLEAAAQPAIEQQTDENKEGRY